MPILPDSLRFVAVVVDEYALAVGLAFPEVAHPSPAAEVHDALALSLVVFEVAFVFLPVVFLHSDESFIGFVIGVRMTNYLRFPVVLSASAIEFALLELPHIPDILIVPEEFPESLHLSFLPLAQILFALFAGIESLAFSSGFFIEDRSLESAVVVAFLYFVDALSYVHVFAVGVEVSLLGSDGIVVLAGLTGPVIPGCSIIFVIVVLAHQPHLGEHKTPEIVGMLFFLLFRQVLIVFLLFVLHAVLDQLDIDLLIGLQLVIEFVEYRSQ